ncbi:hypothetical protein [Caulobacter henricii]|uniref:hypothetical protein n=1 Tax=Caulobacter henricii TaxID=69395 RepID=UPI000A49DF11
MTIAELLAREAELTEQSRDLYGPYLATAMESCGLMATALARIDENRALFAAMHAVVCKHMILAALSFVRRHRVQGSMNLRQVTESAQRACYFLAHQRDHVVRETDEELVVSETKVKEKTYAFFDRSMGEHAEAFRQAKKIINMTEAHASLRGAQLIFRRGAQGNNTFFDADDPVLVNVGLWSIINTAIGVLDAYHLANAQFGGLQFAEDFGDRFAAVSAMRDRLHGELWGDPTVQALEEAAGNEDSPREIW